MSGNHSCGIKSGDVGKCREMSGKCREMSGNVGKMSGNVGKMSGDVGKCREMSGNLYSRERMLDSIPMSSWMHLMCFCLCPP